MGKLTLITGGSRSGKSKFAENMITNQTSVLYIATALATDDDMKKRIEIHKLHRNHSWHTYEGYNNLAKVIKKSKYKYILLECIGTLVTNIMFDSKKNFDRITSDEVKELEYKILSEIKDIVSAVKHGFGDVIIITNEVGMSLVPEYRLGRIFSDILGRVNQLIADNSEKVYVVFCGIPLRLK
ncbi:adenosylcobinamide kinase/adenosylcobinamide-phosphate guanylyltransferase [Clostridium algifaecis]|uniref:Adenosylcobinamide kinase n=1 Tax=Clostridium algifaecis TaxID=1472040 RepID=A0ABS4KUB3_9CLOT|nr:bifunctional adenosylcobinamide kinase/adenosylcobinamide-phosphate guanylyltransferase [Clostridium algifaecis]MBP2033644.1 adenosylcobinamide kinase/adenosylcobinamide-phosphate guanylyltransferase [Clostridium algifaecis]